MEIKVRYVCSQIVHLSALQEHNEFFIYLTKTFLPIPVEKPIYSCVALSIWATFIASKPEDDLPRDFLQIRRTFAPPFQPNL